MGSAIIITNTKYYEKRRLYLLSERLAETLMKVSFVTPGTGNGVLGHNKEWK